TTMQEKFDSAQMAAAMAPDYDQFVGRDTEVGVLRAEFYRANEGKARPALILGDPGSGKTQILSRFQQWVQEQGASAGMSNFFDYGGKMVQPYQVLLNMLANVLELQESDSRASVDFDLVKKIASLVKEKFGLDLPTDIFEREADQENTNEKWRTFEALRH